LAFSVDVGWMVVVKTELQNAADAAALAGAEQLQPGYVQYNLPSQSGTNKAAILTASKTTASTWAKNFAGYNRGGNVSLTLLDSDIDYGFTDTSGTYTSQASGSYPANTFPNTIKVKVRRYGTAN